jgi:hypothetical protein
LLIISHYVKPGSADLIDYLNHYSLLATIENLLGLKHIGYASASGLPTFPIGLYNG